MALCPILKVFTCGGLYVNTNKKLARTFMAILLHIIYKFGTAQHTRKLEKFK